MRRRSRRRGDQIDQREARHDEERLHHLRQEREPDQRPGADHPARGAALERPHEAVRRRDEQQTSSASGLLKRNISAATGVSASTAPASSPAPAPNQRLTAREQADGGTPSSACGTSMLELEKPKMRPDSAITHSEAGGLSTVMKFDESSEPKKNAFQLFVPACTAAA